MYGNKVRTIGGAVKEVLVDEMAPVDALMDVKPTGENVKISGGNCYIRTGPNTAAKDVGVAHKGDVLPYAGETAANGWLKIVYKNKNAWVSGKYGKLN